MSETKGFRKFEIVFHILITLFGLGIITSYIVNEFQILYVILGVGIVGSSLFRLLKLLNKGQLQE